MPRDEDFDPNDPSQHELARISVDSLHDWQRIKRAYYEAALVHLDAQLTATNRLQDRAVFVPHIAHVRQVRHGITSCSQKIF
jgi:hypothetical protein